MKTIEIEVTDKQHQYLMNECAKQNLLFSQYIQQLLDIQMDMQEALETDLTVDMWDN